MFSFTSKDPDFPHFLQGGQQQHTVIFTIQQQHTVIFTIYIIINSTHIVGVWIAYGLCKDCVWIV